MRRTYILTLHDQLDDSKPLILKSIELFELAAHSLRAETKGGPIVSHECERYETPHGTFEYVPPEAKHAR